jgi:multicomponent Na+:H+ antiporter subunit D
MPAWLLLIPGFAALALWLARPAPRTSRVFSLAVAALLMVLALRLVVRTGGGEIVVHAFGGWRAPYGIAFAVDRLSALFVALHAALLLVTLGVLRPQVHGARTLVRAHPLLFALTAGLFGAFMTGDLFNLFVMFELVLVVSYLLLQVPGSDRSLTAALPVVVVNVLASALFLAGLAVLYGIGGSTNLADLTQRFADAPPALRRAGLGLLVAAFATKAAVVPLCFWMPASYPTLSAPLAALFAGIMSKLGVYALLRTQPLLAIDPTLGDALVWAGGLSALVGVLAALSQYEMRRLLAFHSVSQVGYMVLALGLGSETGVAAAIFFALHHSLVKSALYLVADELERRNATRDLRRMDFRKAADTTLVACFGLAAFSLAGLPPFSGFLGKLGVFRAAWEGGERVGLALLVTASLFTLASMLKIWRFSFQRRPMGDGGRAAAPIGARPPLAAIATLILALGFGAAPVFEYARQAAAGVLDPAPYAGAVLATGDHPRPGEGEAP